MGDLKRWAELWSQHGGVHGLGFGSLLGYWTLGIECGSDAGERGGQLALDDASSDSIGYIRGGIRCLSRAVKKFVFFLGRNRNS